MRMILGLEVESSPGVQVAAGQSHPQAKYHTDHREIFIGYESDALRKDALPGPRSDRSVHPDQVLISIVSRPIFPAWILLQIGILVDRPYRDGIKVLLGAPDFFGFIISIPCQVISGAISCGMNLDNFCISILTDHHPI